MSFLTLSEVKVHFALQSSGLLGRREKDVIRAVDGVSLQVKKGEILGLVGESGCGKSTLSRAIMQLEKVTSGSISLEGQELSTLQPAEIRRRRLDFQMIFQDPYASLNPRMTVERTLVEALTRRKPLKARDRSEHVAHLMERVGLDPQYAQKYPHEFSGGQRQRIAIARALAPEPKLIIADEPVSALDVSIQSQILNLLVELRRDLNLTMIFITHDLSVVQFLADQIAVMQRGKVVEYAPTEALFSDPQESYTQSLLQAIPRIPKRA